MSEQSKWLIRSMSSFFLGWVTGAAAGAVAALLIAPQSGAETQQQLRRQAETLQREADRIVEEGRRKAEGRVAEARAAVSDRLKQGAAVLEPEG